MVRYEREFLVPYLEDICSLHLAKRKVEELIAEAEVEISEINNTALSCIQAPVLERYRKQDDLDGVGKTCLGAGITLFAVVLFLVSAFIGSSATLVLAAVLGIVGGAISIYSTGEKDRVNAEIKRRNDEKERNHAVQELAALSAVEPKVDKVKERISFYKKEMQRIDDLLEEQYNVNVIPRWYRDIYPAVYLYDWFSTGRSDDLDMALNTFVLEQIKERLDTIIANQSQIIMNQRITIANQYKAMEQQERHAAMLMSKLDQIEASNEERNIYLNMIESNTAANAYFAAANYLKA